MDSPIRVRYVDNLSDRLFSWVGGISIKSGEQKTVRRSLMTINEANRLLELQDDPDVIIPVERLFEAEMVRRERNLITLPSIWIDNDGRIVANHWELYKQFR